MNKEQVDSVIEYFGEFVRVCNCDRCSACMDNIKTLKEIMIGDVIFKKDNEFWTWPYKGTSKLSNLEVLYAWWYEFENKSLQEIRDESGFELPSKYDKEKFIENLGATELLDHEKLKDPNASALFTFLNDILK